MNLNIDIDNSTLIEECRKGDKEALNLFYILFAPKMFSVIRRYVSDTNDAEDILHDGFIVAFTRLGSLRDYGKVDFWLATIMKNLSLQFLNNQDLSKVLHDIPEVEDTPSMEEIIDFDTLEQLIRKLPAGYQKVFRLAVLENKSHKEISKILGIAPNSSSSQLFHAKLMMRKLITEYQRQTGVFILFLVVLISGFMLIKHGLQDEGESKVQFAQITAEESDSCESSVELPESEQGSTFGSTVMNPASPSSQHITSAGRSSHKTHFPSSSGIIVNSVDSSAIDNNYVLAADSVAKTMIADNLSSDDHNKTSEIPDVSEPSINTNDQKYSASKSEDEYYGYSSHAVVMPDVKKTHSVWSVSMSVDTGIGMSEKFGYGKEGPFFAGPFHPNNWGFVGLDDLSGYEDNDKKSGQSRGAGMAQTRGATNFRNYNYYPHHNDMPISFSVVLNRAVYKFISLETGLSYTYLHSSFETSRTKSECQWHYLGIPIKLKVDFFSSKRLRLYSSTGIQFDMPLYSKADVTSDILVSELRAGKFSSPVVWSWSVNAGMAFRLNRKIDIFIEPTLQYHFGPDHEVPNVWTDNPWGFSLPVGFRFNW